MNTISSIRSGGQTGADRAALDAALSLGYPILGWCPKNGWAEDMPEAPGLTEKYPQLIETPLEDIMQRTEWNVRDSDATILVYDEFDFCSMGTDYTAIFAEKYNKPHLNLTDQSVEEVLEWLIDIGCNLNVNFAGPRESEKPGTYDKAYNFVKELLIKDQHNIW